MTSVAVPGSSQRQPPLHESLVAVAHDLKLPLSHIKGLVSSLRRDDLTWDEDTRQEFLAEIESEADRLAQMLELLMRSQSKRARQQEPTLTEPAALVDQAVRRLRDVCGDRPIRVEVAPGLARIRVHASRIERVLVNLLQNAVKYSSPDTPICIAARMHRHHELEFAVDNDGPCIPMDDLHRLFDPFFRTKTAAESNVPGHGLGLAICQSIALAHGGRMGVTPRPGGTRFSLYLPLRKQSSTRPKLVLEAQTE